MTEKSQVNILGENIFHIKNFLTEEMLSEALALENMIDYEADKNYAGRMAKLTDSLSDKILSLFQQYDPKIKKVITARLRAATHEDVEQLRSFVHADNFAYRVCVVYLHNSLYVDQEQAGTPFWEHVHSKAKKVEPHNKHHYLMHKFIMDRDTTDTSKWKQWLCCPFEENSALFFDGCYFHSPPNIYTLQKNEVGKRLTLDIFFD